MNLSTIKTAVTSKVGRQLLLAQKNSPHLLFATGVVGVGAGVVLACRATLKVDAVAAAAQSKLKDIKAMEYVDYTEDDRKKDMAIVYIRTAAKICKLYAPSALVLGLSVAALTKSHTILNSRNAALGAAYAGVDKAFKEYRKRVTDSLGEDADREFRYGSVDHEYVQETDKGMKKVVAKRVKPGEPSMYARFFDELCPDFNRQPEYNFLFVRSVQNFANDMLRARGHLFLNEVYDMLGIPRTGAGQVVGWVLENGDGYVDFGVFDGDNAMARNFVNGREGAILLDFNVDGVVHNLI